MDIKKLFLFILIIINMTFVFSQSLNEIDYLKLEIDNEIEFGINFKDESKVNELDVTSYFFTQTFKGSQYLNSFETDKNEYIIQNESGIMNLKYIYDDDNLEESNKINNKFTLESTTHRPKIKEKEVYPISEEKVEEINSTYLLFSEFIDTNSKIKSQASSLAAGEDDVYIISSKIAKWIIEDIEYDLDTIYDNPNQKSTEVFNSKEGVCREITNLFISMLRSIGIPARVAIGYAYTDSQELIDFVGSNWGGHAWAEVLIGEEWVPFDLTYNQYGFVDATHIATDKFHEIRPRSITVSGKGYGFDIIAGSLSSQPTFNVIDQNDNLYDPGFNLKITGPDEIGFGSYGYLKLDIENEEDFYQLLFLKFAMPEEVEILDLQEKMYVFMPNEKKEVFFRFKLPDDLDPSLIYTFPFTVYNDYMQESYEISSREEYLSIKQIALPEEVETQTTLSNNKLSANCNFILDTPNNLVICSLKNPNNYEVNNVEVCFNNDCKFIDLKVGSFESISFETNEMSGILKYESSVSSNEFEISALIPKMGGEVILDNETFSITVNSYLANLIADLTILYYINDNLTYSNIAQEDNSEKINLNPGSYELRVDLTFKNETIDSYTSNIFFKDRTIWEKFKIWLVELITF